LFVPVEDGEFVLISSGNQAGPNTHITRSARFATRRDFYEFYQDYYHCTKPDAGEVYVIQPAEVARSAGGWKLQAPGILEVLEDQPKKKASTDAVRHEVDTPPHQEPKHVIAPIKRGVTRYALSFLWLACGKEIRLLLEMRQSIDNKERVLGYHRRSIER